MNVKFVVFCCFLLFSFLMVKAGRAVASVCPDTDQNGGDYTLQIPSPTVQDPMPSVECKLKNNGTLPLYTGNAWAIDRAEAYWFYTNPCSFILLPGQECIFRFEKKFHTDAGMWYSFTGSFIETPLVPLKWTYTIDGYVPPVDPPDPVDPEPEDPEDPDAPINEEEDRHVEPGKCVKTNKSSVIRVDNLTFGEVVPVVGTELSLVYSSEFAEEYTVPYDKIHKHVSFNPEGWSVSTVHYYDVDEKRIYHGGGRSFGKPSMDLNASEIMVVEGNEVFVFGKTTGRHLRTLSALTGIVIRSNYYTATGKLDRIIDMFGNETTFSRRADGSLQKVTSPFGRETAVLVNGVGLISRITNPANESHHIEYHAGKELLRRFVMPSGRITEVNYDAKGRLTRTRSAGAGWDFKLTGDGDTNDDANYVKQTSASGQVWKYNVSRASLDGKYRRWEKSPAGEVETYYENEDGSATVVSSAGTYIVDHDDDPRFGALKSRQSMEEVKIGALKKVSYFDQYINGLGASPFDYASIEEEVEVNGIRATSLYTKSTGKTDYESPQGVQWYTKINLSEQLTEYKHATDESVFYEYDAFGRIKKATQGLRTLFEIQYDNFGQIGSITKSGQGSIGYQYDLAGRVSLVSFPNNSSLTIQYNQDGLVSGVTPSGKPTHAIGYGTLGLVQSYTPPDVSGGTQYSTTYKYDHDKRLISYKRPGYEPIEHIYARNGNLEESKYGKLRQSYVYKANSSRVVHDVSFDGVQQTYKYLGSLLESVYQVPYSGGERFSKITYSYDSLFRLKDLKVAADYLSSDFIVRYVYDRDSKIVRMGPLDYQYSAVTGRLVSSSLGSVSEVYTYSNYGELIKYEAKYLGQVIYSYEVERDISGRIVKKSEYSQGQNKVFEYLYDDSGRLKGVVQNGVIIGSYHFDSNGNKVSGIHYGKAFMASYDSQDRLLTFNGNEYSYNSNGDLNGITVPVLIGESKFEYNAFGKLSGFIHPNGKVVRYQSDSIGRPVVKIKDGVIQSRYLYDGQLRIISMYNEATRVSKEFAHGGRVNTPVYMSSAGKIYKYIVDHLGSPRLLVDVSSGKIVQEIEYDVWGKEIKNTNREFQPYGYAGGIYDVDTRLVRFGARDYDPDIGRWISKDPILFNGGDTNLYGYVQNDPINWIDPDGEMKLPADPSGLPPGWRLDPSHKDPNGERWRYKDSDRFLDFHKGRPGQKGWKGKDHWHDSKGGEKCPEHLAPGDEIPDPVDPAMYRIDPKSGPFGAPMPIPIPFVFPLPVRLPISI
ncbi:RHS repeat domain-containing protein [Bdellovibrio bacteriovorus]|uniref:RHS repeat domain-containing protein n=1 Tax=Bdellovibrio bacteriovorus TaxID=959 RepID=UPI003A7FCEC0